MSINITKLKKNLLMIGMLLPYYQLNAVKYYVGSSIYYLLVIVGLLTAIFVTLKLNYITKPLVYLFLFSMTLFFSCLFNSRSLLSVGYYCGQILGFVLVHNYYLQKDSFSAFSFLEVERKLLSIIILINVFFQITNQNAFGHFDVSGNYYNFFVSDNYLGYYYIPYISLLIFLDYIKYSRISRNTYFMVAICVISLLTAWSAKAILGIAFVLIYIFISKYKISKKITLKFLIIVYIFISILIVLFNFQYLFSDFIESILHKDASLSGRTYIWQSAIRNIRNSPLIGYGINMDGTISISETYNGTLHASHNIMLEVLLQTGIIGFIFYFSFIYRSLKQKKSYLAQNKIYRMLIFFTFIIFFMYIASHTIYIPTTYLTICICMNLYKLEEYRWIQIYKKMY